MADETSPGDRVVDGRYQALPDPISDRLFSLLMSTTAELWTVRDRLRLMEAALEKHGIPVGELIEDLRDSGDQLDRMRSDREEFVERLFAELVSRLDAEAP